MAVHRRPPVEGPPDEPVEFRLDDWISHPSPYWAWLMARFEWAKTHPDDFDPLDILRQRVAYKRGLPSAYGIYP
jgi:hypothetical protein